MSYTNGLDKPNLYFNTVLYTGNNTTNAITGVGFQPDLVWGKKRDGAGHSQLYDNVRGVRKIINSSLNNVEVTESSGYGLESFDSDGFTLGADPLVASGSINASGGTYASWNWLASNTTASNTDGSITSTVSANTTSGFSIVSYSGTGSNLDFGHGLGAVPDWFMIKNRDVDQAWRVYHKSMGFTKRLVLSETGAESASAVGLNGSPTSSLINLDTSTDCTNASGENYICYAFAEKKGFSKFGSYTGNGSTDGTFVYLGFKPAFVMIKRTDSTGSWPIEDSARSPSNSSMQVLYSNLNNEEETLNPYFDLLSNGFKIRWTSTFINASGGTYIYMAFAENPFVTIYRDSLYG
jgi:hypothetical protein